jgi:hypothetical protein
MKFKSFANSDSFDPISPFLFIDGRLSVTVFYNHTRGLKPIGTHTGADAGNCPVMPVW